MTTSSGQRTHELLEPLAGPEQLSYFEEVSYDDGTAHVTLSVDSRAARWYADNLPNSDLSCRAWRALAYQIERLDDFCSEQEDEMDSESYQGNLTEIGVGTPVTLEDLLDTIEHTLLHLEEKDRTQVEETEPVITPQDAWYIILRWSEQEPDLTDEIPDLVTRAYDVLNEYFTED